MFTQLAKMQVPFFFFLNQKDIKSRQRIKSTLGDCKKRWKPLSMENLVNIWKKKFLTKNGFATEY